MIRCRVSRREIDQLCVCPKTYARTCFRDANSSRKAAVSCNPVTLARDLEILIAGGYALKSVTPVDQFLWSPHVEAVALLEKPKKRH